MNEEHLIADVPVKALISKNDTYLFVKDTDGLWTLPGGRMNVGEMPEEALRREVREELGVEIDIGPLIGCTTFTSGSGSHHLIVVFSAALKDPNAEMHRQEAEISEVLWAAKEHARELKLRPEYEPVLGPLFAAR